VRNCSDTNNELLSCRRAFRRPLSHRGTVSVAPTVYVGARPICGCPIGPPSLNTPTDGSLSAVTAETLSRALNAHLPEEVRVLSVEEAAPDFHARFNARSKTYRYQIRTTPIADPFTRAYEWHIPEALDIAAMRQGAQALVGTHDFAAFRSAGGETAGTVRTVTRSELSDRSGLLTYEIAGDGFLRHMVRALVGTLVEVGRGWRAPDNIGALLQGATRDHAGRTAPPHGLFLVRVDYH